MWVYIDARLGLRPSECTALQTEDYANHLDRDAQRRIGAAVMDIF